MKNHLFNIEKINYIKGEKPKVECILCAIRDKLPDVTQFEVYRTDDFIVSLNLYPYNPGHLMIFPTRHIEELAEMTDNEALLMHQLTSKAISVLKDEFNPSGFNIGYNLGTDSGASLYHIHQHIVPRYENEIGFIDIIGGTRVFVVDPLLVLEKLKKKFAL